MNKEIKRAKKFTIDRSKWYRGKGDCNSKLLRKDGSMCCVGFYAKACGLSDEDIIDKPTINDVYVIEEHEENRIEVSDPVINIIYNTNDNVNISEADREKGIYEQFIEMGVQVDFVDKLAQ